MILQIEIKETIEGHFLAGFLEGYLQTTQPLSPTNQNALDMLTGWDSSTDRTDVADAVALVAKMLVASREEPEKLSKATAEWLQGTLSRDGEVAPPQVLILTLLDGEHNQIAFMGGQSDMKEALIQMYRMLQSAYKEIGERVSLSQKKSNPPAPMGKGGTA